MKQAGARALAFCDNPPARPRIALIFGADPGLVSTSADALVKAWAPGPDPINIAKLGDDDLKRDPQLLADELVARSLLDGTRLVRLKAEKDASYKLILEIIADVDKGALIPEAFWIIEAGELNKTNKLRTGIEACGCAIALQLYSDDEASVLDLAAKRLARAGTVIDPDALSAFVADLPGDRRLALSELEKLELYAVGLGRSVTTGDVALLASAEQPRGADDAADAAIIGDAPSATLSVNRYLDAGGSAISALRMLQFRLMRVSDAVATGASSGQRLRPPIFEREWPQFSRALGEWPARRIHRAFSELYEAEKACKQGGAPAEAILRQLIHRIAVRSI